MNSPQVALCLTVRQPWAWALCAGYKDVENRRWPTAHRGRLLIHAGKTDDPDGWERLHVMGAIPPDTLVGGAIVGEVVLVDVVRGHPSRWAEPGDDVWHWAVRDAVLWPRPVKWRGQPGLFPARLDQLDASRSLPAPPVRAG